MASEHLPTRDPSTGTFKTLLKTTLLFFYLSYLSFYEFKEDVSKFKEFCTKFKEFSRKKHKFKESSRLVRTLYQATSVYIVSS